MKSLIESINESSSKVREKNINAWRQMLTILSGSNSYDSDMVATLRKVLTDIIDGDKVEEGRFTTYDYTMWIGKLCERENKTHKESDYTDLMVDIAEDNPNVRQFKKYHPYEEE